MRSCPSEFPSPPLEKSYPEEGEPPRDSGFWATQKTESPNGNQPPTARSASSRRRTDETRRLAKRRAGATSERPSPPDPEPRRPSRCRAAAGKRIELR